MLIRHYKNSDRKAVEKINFETGFLGKSMREILSSRGLWNNTVSYYLEKEPDAAFVIEEEGEVVGYLLGSLGRREFNRAWYYVKLLLQIIFALPHLRKKDLIYWKGKLHFYFLIGVGVIKKQKLKSPPNSAHFHIDILPHHRGGNKGTKLLEAFLEYAKSQGIKKVYANSYLTGINPNVNFWLKNDFRQYDKVISFFWRDQHPTETIYYVCYVKDIK